MPKMRISVLRLGHRGERDKRVSTHCGLVARALGASEIILCGERDEGTEKSIEKIAEKWGGKFRVSYSSNWLKTLREFRGIKIHLTMYGEPLMRVVKKIKKRGKKILVVVGAGKVPGGVYRECDFNVSVTTQPHSEIAALALFLRECFGSQSYEKKFAGAKIIVTPSARSKIVEKNKI